MPKKEKGPSALERRLAAVSASSAAASSMARPRGGKRTVRGDERAPSYRFATVVVNGKFEHKAILKDLSDTGARIVLEGLQTLPPVVVLKVAQTGARMQARVVWQHDTEAGLSFEAAAN